MDAFAEYVVRTIVNVDGLKGFRPCFSFWNRRVTTDKLFIYISISSLSEFLSYDTDWSMFGRIWLWSSPHKVWFWCPPVLLFLGFVERGHFIQYSICYSLVERCKHFDDRQVFISLTLGPIVGEVICGLKQGKRERLMHYQVLTERFIRLILNFQ